MIGDSDNAWRRRQRVPAFAQVAISVTSWARWIRACRIVVRQVSRAWRQAESVGLHEILGLLWCALRLLPHAAAMERLLHESQLAQQLMQRQGGDPLLGLHHREFLMRGQSMALRLNSLVHHLSTESRSWTPCYLSQVYGSGLTLWQREVAGVHLRLLLRSWQRESHEGLISVALEVDGQDMHVMSLTWVPGAVLLLPHDLGRSFALITRNQCLRPNGAAMSAYRTVYPQVAAQYLCLAAIQGLVSLRGHSELLAVPHDRQIAFQRRFDAGFRHSYSDLWENLSGQRHGSVYRMPLPTPWPPLEQVPAKHRRRARERRRLGAEVMAATQQVLQPMLRHSTVEEKAGPVRQPHVGLPIAHREGAGLP